MIQIDIYYSQLKYEAVTQQPGYGLLNLFSKYHFQMLIHLFARRPIWPSQCQTRAGIHNMCTLDP